jgi:hypothetical protein
MSALTVIFMLASASSCNLKAPTVRLPYNDGELITTLGRRGIAAGHQYDHLPDQLHIIGVSSPSW